MTRAVAAGFLFLIFIPFIVTFPAAPTIAGVADTVRAESFILMDADTGQILLEREMHAQRKPASITKIMTTLLALEKGSPGDPVTVSAAAVSANAKDGSSAGLAPGEIIPLDEILYAVMLESANEAANAVAEFVSGTMEDFAVSMTSRAIELGAINTHFANANGLNDDGHYTSAYDMALITREAIKNPRFLMIWGTYQHFLSPTNLQAERRIFNNKNRMLPQGSMPYPGILGGKTGFTSASQNTLVEAARREDRTLICVLLQGPGALSNFQDAVLLFDYGFNEFQSVTYENDEYPASIPFLLHNSLSIDEIDVACAQPAENTDGSSSVAIRFTAPRDSEDLMYPHIAAPTLTIPAPPSAEPDPSGRNADTEGEGNAEANNFGFLPGWLLFVIRTILRLFAVLFVLACFFRTRRWIRRRKRLIMKRRTEARRKAYREQQSYWS